MKSLDGIGRSAAAQPAGRRRRRGFAIAPIVALAVALAGGGAADDDDAPPPATPPAAAGDAAASSAPPPRAIEGLRQEHPDLVRVALQIDAIVAELAGDAAANPSSPETGAVSRLLAAELCDAIGDEARARALYNEVAATSADWPALRAEARYRLGLQYLLKENYPFAWSYWRTLADAAGDPASPWVARAARYAPFLRLCAELRQSQRAEPSEPIEPPAMPAWSGVFGELGERGGADFAGKWVLLELWQTGVADAVADTRRLAAAIAVARKQGWDGVVLGVNLDRSRESFERALAEWKTSAEGESAPARDWPQHHDGLGFESPLARAIGVPRAPIALLIDPRGRLAYVSGLRQDLEKTLLGTLAGR